MYELILKSSTKERIAYIVIYIFFSLFFIKLLKYREKSDVYNSLLMGK